MVDGVGSSGAETPEEPQRTSSEEDSNPPSSAKRNPLRVDDDESSVEKARRDVKFATVGIQFTSGIVIFTGAGWWIDQRFGCEPIGVVVGGAIGFVASTAWLIQTVYGSNSGN